MEWNLMMLALVCCAFGIYYGIKFKSLTIKGQRKLNDLTRFYDELKAKHGVEIDLALATQEQLIVELMKRPGMPLIVTNLKEPSGIELHVRNVPRMVALHMLCAGQMTILSTEPQSHE